MAERFLPAPREFRGDSDRLKMERAAVAAGVRSRCPLLELEIYERVDSRVPELGIGRDVERQAQARATISVIVEYCLRTIEQGSLRRSVPEAVLERARLAARKGASVGPLLRAIESGYQPFVAYVIAEVMRLPRAIVVREHLREVYGGLLGDIAAAVERAYERERWAQPVALDRNSVVHSSNTVRSLTRREREVLDLLLEGRSYKEIGRALHVTPDTVHTHASHVYRKLGIKGRRSLAGRRR